MVVARSRNKCTVTRFYDLPRVTQSQRDSERERERARGAGSCANFRNAPVLNAHTPRVPRVAIVYCMCCCIAIESNTYPPNKTGGGGGGVAGDEGFALLLYTFNIYIDTYLYICLRVKLAHIVRSEAHARARAHCDQVSLSLMGLARRGWRSCLPALVH